MPQSRSQSLIIHEETWPDSVDHYSIVAEVGTGATAKVYEAICKTNNQRVAIKVIDLEGAEVSLDDVRHEIITMLKFHHPNLVRCYTAFTVGNTWWLVMELLECSMYDIMQAKHADGIKDEALITAILKQVLAGLQYLHSMGYMHRDLKCSNILVSQDGSVRLCDFGVAAGMCEDGVSRRRGNRTTFVGTLCWMAPEVMEQSNGYDYSADMWSFGITALELATGHAPFSSYPPMKVMLMTLQNDAPTVEGAMHGKCKFSAKFRAHINSCLTKDCSKRPTANYLSERKLFRTAKKADHISKMLGEEIKEIEKTKGSGRAHKSIEAKQTQDALQAQTESHKRKPVSFQSWNWNETEVDEYTERAISAKQSSASSPPPEESPSS